MRANSEKLLVRGVLDHLAPVLGIGQHGHQLIKCLVVEYQYVPGVGCDGYVTVIR